MIQTIEINDLTIIGQILEIGDDDRGLPVITIEDNYGNKIVLDVSREDVLKLSSLLYEEVSMKFNAKFEFIKKEDIVVKEV